MSETNEEKAEGRIPKAKSEKPENDQDGRQPMEVIPSREEKTLIEWQALERPFQKKDKEFWTTILSILGLVCLILFFVQEWFLIATLVALTFLYYVLTTVRPNKRNYKISNKGVYLTNSERIDWEFLRRFWISGKWGSQMIHFETWLKFPRVISFVIPEDEEEKMAKIVEKYIPQEEVSPQFLDKFSTWVAKRIPVETETAKEK